MAVLVAGSSVARAENVAAARACVGITDRDARLACFDAAYAPAVPRAAAAPTTAAAEQSPPQVAPQVVPPPAVPAVAPRSSAPPPAASFGDEGQLAEERRERAKVPRTLTAALVAVTALPKGFFRLSLDNGQVWQTIQAFWALDFQSGDRVTITHMLAGYQLSHEGSGRSVGAKRIQ